MFTFRKVELFCWSGGNGRRVGKCVSCLYLISQVFPEALGLQDLEEAQRPGGLELNALVTQMMAFLIRPSFLSRLSSCGSQYPAFPTFYTDTSIPPVSPTPWVSLQAIAHVAPSVFHPLPLFSTWWPSSSLSSNSISPVELLQIPQETFFMPGSSCTLYYDIRPMHCLFLRAWLQLHDEQFESGFHLDSLAVFILITSVASLIPGFLNVCWEQRSGRMNEYVNSPLSLSEDNPTSR